MLSVPLVRSTGTGFSLLSEHFWGAVIEAMMWSNWESGRTPKWSQGEAGSRIWVGSRSTLQSHWPETGLLSDPHGQSLAQLCPDLEMLRDSRDANRSLGKVVVGNKDACRGHTYACMYISACVYMCCILGLSARAHLLATKVLLSDSTSRLCRGQETDAPGAVSPAGQWGGRGLCTEMRRLLGSHPRIPKKAQLRT